MIVIDASVWISVYFVTDAFNLLSRQWMRRQNTLGQRFVVPGVFLAEVAGAVARKSGNPSLGREAMQSTLESVSFDVRDVDRELAVHSAELAATLSLRGADAIYVALAHQLSLPLVTWDREQLQRGAQIITVQTPETVGDLSDETRSN